MNNVRVVTPDGEIIGERLVETENTIIVKTAQGRLSIDKVEGVSVFNYNDAAANKQGTIFIINTIYGRAAYLKTRKNYWTLVWQSSIQGNDNPALGDSFMTDGTEINFTQLLQLYIDGTTVV
jgi:hypothetical protein